MDSLFPMESSNSECPSKFKPDFKCMSFVFVFNFPVTFIVVKRAPALITKHNRTVFQ